MALELETTEYLLQYLQANNDRSAGVLLNQLKKVQGAWSAVEEDAPAVERQIQPLIKSQRSHSKPDLEEYEQAVESYAAQHKEAGFWKHEVGPDEAEKLISEAERRHAEEKSRFKKMDYLSTMLEMPEEMDKSRELMERVESDLKNVRELWGVSRECIAFVKGAKDQLWKDVMADELEEQTKALLKKVRASLPPLRGGGGRRPCPQHRSPRCCPAPGHWPEPRPAVERRLSRHEPGHEGLPEHLPPHCGPGSLVHAAASLDHADGDDRQVIHAAARG